MQTTNSTQQPEDIHMRPTTQPILRKSKLFPNVDISQYREPARYQTTPNPVTTDNLNPMHQEWGKHGPSDTGTLLHDNRPLPALQPHKLVQHVRVPYIGKESSYTWYHTFRSAVQQYGILLIPIEQFKRDKCLCPQTYYGTPIDATRYREMTDALYQLLALTDTVAMEHTEVRNIIQWYATNTDGYATLYEIMERIHPILNPDAKLHAPLSINCSDIHDYANQLDSYFLHNSLENVHYTARCKVNIFLEGLDSSFASAIRQIRQQLRSWPEGDTQLPPDLNLNALPRLVEIIMQEEEHNTPIIRTMQKSAKPQHNNILGRTKPYMDTNTRTYVDIQCLNCKAFGHKYTNCDKTAQYILITEAVKDLSEKSKAKILENYTKQTTDRRAHRLRKVKGTMRQLYSEGHTQEADALLDQCMTCQGNESDSSTSTSE
jgi:hypothetical protein